MTGIRIEGVLLASWPSATRPTRTCAPALAVIEKSRTRARTGATKKRLLVIDGSGLAAPVEPALEERIEVALGDVLGQGDELLDRAAAVAVPFGPVVQHPQHRLRPDLQPQRL